MFKVKGGFRKIMKEQTSKVLKEETAREVPNDTEYVECLILLVATHETGHYIVNRALINYRRTILLSTMFDTDEGSLGRHKSVERKDVEKQKEDYINEIAILLAGIVATHIFLTEEFIKDMNEDTTIHQDFMQALKLANEIAPEYCCKSQKICKTCKKWPKHLQKQFLESARDEVLTEAMRLAIETILKHKNQYVKVRRELIIKRELSGDELEQLYNLE